MQVVINGQNHDTADGQTLSGLLDSLGLDSARVAIELDGRIVPRPEWPASVLSPGARLEIVHFVGGG